MEQSNKKPIVRNIWDSITNFDKYQEFATEKKLDSLIFFIVLIIIFSFIATITYSVNVHLQINKISKYFESYINEIEFKETKLTVNNNEKTIIENNKEYVIIDTGYLENDKTVEYESSIKDKDKATIILSDRIIMKSGNSSEVVTFLYKDLVGSNQDISINKQDIQNMLKGSDVIFFYVILMIVTFVAMFLVYAITMLVYVIILAILGKISCVIIRLPMNARSLVKIAVHALTLPTILHIIYFVVNLYTGYTINYFQLMYSAIAYIYIITAIFIIKTDYTKKQAELNEIRNEQNRIREEYSDEQNQDSNDENN